MTITASNTTTVKWLPEAYGNPDGTWRGIWFADDSRFQGVWGEGDTREEALNDMCEVLRHWWALTAECGGELPSCDVTLTSSTGGA